MKKIIIIISLIFIAVLPSSADYERLSDYLLSGNWARIARDGTTWARKETENPVPYYFLQIAYYALNRLDEANDAHVRIKQYDENGRAMRELAEELIKANPDNPYAYIPMEYVHYYAGEYQEMKKLVEKAIELNPDHGPLYFDLALAYDQAGYRKRALEIALEGIKKAPDFLVNYLYAGTRLRREADGGEAVNIFQEAIEKNIKAGNPTAYFHHQLGIIYLRNAEYEKAVEILKEGIRIKPERENLYVVLGDVYINKGDLQSAKEAYETASEKVASGNLHMRAVIESKKHRIKQQILEENKQDISGRTDD